MAEIKYIYKKIYIYSNLPGQIVVLRVVVVMLLHPLSLPLLVHAWVLEVLPVHPRHDTGQQGGGHYQYLPLGRDHY